MEQIVVNFTIDNFMKKFPQKTISRAFVYIRVLAQLVKSGKEYVSSKDLAELTGLTDVQIRKDISNFGRVGRPRVGYETKELKKVLEKYVGQHPLYVVLFGVGNLGSAIAKYPGFQSEKVKLVAAFDVDQKKIGKTINGTTVYHVESASIIIPQTHAEIGVIATPVEYSQMVADVIVNCGLKGIINFSPTVVSVPQGVYVKNIDLTIEFLSFFCGVNK